MVAPDDTSRGPSPRNSRHKRIAHRLSRAFLLTVLLPLLFLGAGTSYLMRDILQGEILARNEAFVIALGRTVRQHVSGGQDAARALAQHPATKRALAAKYDLLMLQEGLQRLYEESPLFRGIIILEPAGVVLVSSPRGTTALGNSFAGAEYVEQARRHHLPMLGAPTRSRLAGHPLVVPFAVPIEDSDGVLLGVLVAAIDLGELRELIESAGRGAGTVRLVTATRLVIAHTEASRIGTLAAADDLAVTRALSGRSGVMKAVEGEARLAAYEYLPDLGWALIVEVPAAAAFAPLQELRAAFLGLLCVAAAISMVSARWIAVRITRPVRVLRNAAAVMSRGDFSQRVRVATGDELEELGTGFNDMAGRLQQTIAQLFESRQRLAFLAEASVLLSETLDYEVTFTRLGELCVHHLADWCVIDRREDGRLERVAGAHVDSEKRPLLDELARRHPARWDGSSPASQVLRNGKPVLHPELTQEMLRSLTQNEEHFRLLQALGTRAAMAVPLVARGQTLGVLTLGSGRPGRYGREALELAQEVARRAALAIDNARLYRQAEEAIRARDVLLGVAAHELRTPLTSLKLRLDKLHRLAAVTPQLPVMAEPVTRVLSAIGTQTRRLGTLVEQLLDVARLSSGGAQLRREEVDLREVVREVVEGFQEQLARSGSRLVLQAEGAIVGQWDRSRLEQVVANLLGNAIKFGEGRPIEVGITATAERATLSVTDHGIGLSDEAKARIFGKFERAVSDRHYGGLGLGLYITRQVVKAHGGTIAVESAPGQGATFTVELPREGDGVPRSEGDARGKGEHPGDGAGGWK